MVLNRHIISTSTLYRRIEFIVNSLFIPFFLISIGILVSFKVYVNQTFQIALLIIMIVMAVAGEFFAALLTRMVFRIFRTKTNLLFGLSVSRAASAIAIILIVFNMGIIPEAVHNNTVILILVTNIISSYITRKAGKGIISGDFLSPALNTRNREKILVSITKPASSENLLEFAGLIKNEENNFPVYPLTVFPKYKEVREKISENNEMIKELIKSLHTNFIYKPGTQIDSNITNRILRAAEEIVATTIVMGWNNRTTPYSILFGNVLKKL